ncbi:MAG: hypothetical protein V2J89_11705, partial [Halieaceae bacterium]|nr:hypothetical protein [Halieaceae bacterium]
MSKRLLALPTFRVPPCLLRAMFVAFLGILTGPAMAATEKGAGERAPIMFKPVQFNKELDDGRVYLLVHDHTPAEDRFLPPPRNLKPAPYMMVDLRPNLITYNIKHYRDHQGRYPQSWKGKPAPDSKEMMLRESNRLHQDHVIRLSYGGETRYVWGSYHSDTHVVRTGDTRFYGLGPGKHAVHATVWLENGYRFDQNFTLAVGEMDARRVKSLEEAESRDLPRSRERAGKANARFHEWTQHLDALLKFVPEAMKHQGRTPEQMGPYFDEIYAMVAGIPTFEADRNWRSQNDRETWESYRARQYQRYLAEYAELIATYGGPDRLWLALDYANQMEAVSHWPMRLLYQVANSYYGYTGDHLVTRRLLQRAYDNTLRVSRDNLAKGHVLGVAFVDHRKDWPQALIPREDIGPLVNLVPPPAPEEAQPQAPTAMADDALDRIRRMDEILSG